MRARESAPQRATRTGTASRPGTRPRPATSATPARLQPGERHDHDDGFAPDPGSGVDAWVRKLVDAAPPLTGQQRRALALLLNS